MCSSNSLLKLVILSLSIFSITYLVSGHLVVTNANEEPPDNGGGVDSSSNNGNLVRNQNRYPPHLLQSSQFWLNRPRTSTEDQLASSPMNRLRLASSATEAKNEADLGRRWPVKAGGANGGGVGGGSGGGRWSEWSEWSACSKQCLPGESQARSRQCLDHRGSPTKDTSKCPKQVRASCLG